MGEISNDWPEDLLGTNVNKTQDLNFVNNYCWQYYSGLIQV